MPLVLFQKRRFILVSLGLIALAAVLTSCGGGGGGGGGGVETPEEIEGEGAAPEFTAEHDAAPALAPAALGDIVLADGSTLQEVMDLFGLPGAAARGVAAEPQTPQDRKRQIILGMVSQAQTFTDDSVWQFDAGPNPALEPAQNGLAYKYGSRDAFTRSAPSAGCCTERIVGLDCSGMVILSAQAGGINLSTSLVANQLGSAATWNNAIPAEWKVKMKEISVSGNAFETGDIIQGPGHVGIVEVSGGTVSILQSNGRPGCATGGGEDETECDKNRSTARGPKRIPMSQVSQYFGSPRKYLRLSPEAPFTVKLTWGSQPDVDLHIVEPTGTHVWYSSKQGDYGFLDLDDTSSFGPEHYFTQSPADGDYQVGVAFYSGTPPETATIVITAGEHTKTYTRALGSVTGNSYSVVVTVRITTDTNGVKSYEFLEAGTLTQIPLTPEERSRSRKG